MITDGAQVTGESHVPFFCHVWVKKVRWTDRGSAGPKEKERERITVIKAGI